MAKEYEFAIKLAAEMDSKFTRNFDNVQKQMTGLQQGLKQISGARGPDRSSKDADQAAGSFEKARTAAQRFQSIVVRVAQYTGAYAFVNGVIDGFKNAISLVDEFQGSMSQMSVATNASATQMQGLQTVAKHLYSLNLGQNWEDLTDAITITKQVTQQQGVALESTTKNALVYRDVFKGEVAESIRTADTMMKNFGISSSQAYNLLAQGAQKGLDKSGELLDTANEYSVYFKTLGFSANQMFDIFSAGLESGAFNLDKVGDSIKELGIRAKDGSKSSAEGFKALGLNASKMTEAFAAGGPSAQKAFVQVMSAMNKLQDPVKKNAAAVSLFGTQAEDMEKNVIAALGNAQSQFNMTRNSMEEVAAVKYSSLSKQLQAIGRTIEVNVWQPLAGQLLPTLTDWASWFQSTDGKAWSEKIVKSVNGVITAAKDAYSWIVSNWPTIKTTALSLAAGIVTLKASFAALSIIGTVNTLITAYRSGTLLATAAQLGLNVAMLANPMTWIVAGIAAVIAGLVALALNWDSVKAAVVRFWGTVTTTLGNIGGWFSEKFNAAKDAAMNALGGLGTWFGGIGDSIKGTFFGMINWVIDKMNWLIEKMNSISLTAPKWLGGDTFGVNIPTISHVGGYAKGGIVTRPELAWVGEGRSPESIIPHENTPRSRALYAATGRAIGIEPAPSSRSEGTVIHFSPNITIPGGGTEAKDQAYQGVKMSLNEFEKLFNQMNRQRIRVSF